jgi:hypothetical protein
MNLIKITAIFSVAVIFFLLGYGSGTSYAVQQSYKPMARSFEIGCNFLKKNIDSHEVLCHNLSITFLEVLEDKDVNSN